MAKCFNTAGICVPEKNYMVLSLSFEAADELFVSLYSLAAGLIRKIGRILKRQNICQEIYEAWKQPISREFPMDDFGERITELCKKCEKRVTIQNPSLFKDEIRGT